MSSYLKIITFSISLFPFIALLMTLPLLFRQYRKHGAVSKFFLFLSYSFMFYLLSAYLLTILPLPPIESVRNFSGPMQNLRLFQFVRDFFQHSGFEISQPRTWMLALKSPQFIQPSFNFLLTLPFGFYLNYYWKKGWKVTFLLSFLLTLSFETIQRSALFGIYPRPYRLFDVDDLLINTLGSMFGFCLSEKVKNYLPDLNKIEEIIEKRSQSISLVRRFVALMIDLILILFVGVIFPIPIIWTILLVVLLPQVLFAKTFGMKLLHFKIETKSKKRILWRFILGFGLNFSLLFILNNLLNATGHALEQELSMLLYLIMTTTVIVLISAISLFVSIFSKSKQFWFENFTKARVVSTFKKE
ncbi:MAG: VanZ family protein [Streptococcaceae bacterium]|jgi:glycopeptide antibiotics resistance protein|nr:VanZ family protein [Streptococcaceae bacterium]